MALSDIINTSAPVFSAGIFLVFLFIALNFQFFIVYKLNIAGTKTKSTRNFKLIFLGISTFN